MPRLLIFPELRTVKGIPYGRQHIHRLIREAKFPKPIKLSEGTGSTNTWDEGEIDAWLESKKAERDACASTQAA